jgi:hypothetical protein
VPRTGRRRRMNPTRTQGSFYPATAFGAIPVALMIFFAGTAAAATQEGMTAIVNWKAMDNCARQAQAAFPDFTPESNAKRNAKLKECLESSNLPPRQLGAPPR